jgi:hypothetical protein
MKIGSLRPLLFTALIGLYFLVFLYSRNIHRFPVSSAALPALIILAGTVAAWLFCLLFLRDRTKAGILASANILVFFTYGYAFDALRPILGKGGIAEVGANKVLVSGWVLLNAAILLWVFRRPRITLVVGNVLGVASVVLILFPLATCFFFLATDRDVRQSDNDAGLDLMSEAMRRKGLPSPPPDIYHIVLDAYPRNDVLKSAYQYDNDAFTDFLRQKGFRVGTTSFSNYPFTHQSMASALNFDYLDSLVTGIDDGSANWIGLEKLMYNSRSVRLLKRIGYRHIVLLHGWETSPPPLADVALSPDGSPGGRFFSEFENGLISMTPIPHVFRAARSGAIEKMNQHRSRILFALDAMERLPREKGPKLVYCHILAPHGPIVLGPEGEALEVPGETNILRKEDPRAMKDGIVGEIRYLNRRLSIIIERIQARSKGNAIIILQSDHGEAVTEYQDNREFYRQRHGILFALYLPPGADRSGFYASMTPVNFYRYVFASVFGLDLPLLEDRIYSSRRVSPFGLREITDSLKSK